jgi:hypothetical protein
MTKSGHLSTLPVNEENFVTLGYKELLLSLAINFSMQKTVGPRIRWVQGKPMGFCEGDIDYNSSIRHP